MVRQDEVRRQHADDAIAERPHARELDRLSDRGRVAAERGLPQRKSQKRHFGTLRRIGALRQRAVLVGQKGAAQHRAHAQHVEERRCDGVSKYRCVHAIDPAERCKLVLGDRLESLVVRGDALEVRQQQATAAVRSLPPVA